MITLNLPHTARYIPCSISTIARLGDDGRYTLDATPIVVSKLEHSSVYLVDRLTLTTSLSEDDFTASYPQDRAPALTLGYLQGQYSATFQPISLPDYSPRGVVQWIKSAQHDDFLTATIFGSLLQHAGTISAETVTVNISFDIYAVDNSWFQFHFESPLLTTTGQNLRGAI